MRRGWIAAVVAVAIVAGAAFWWPQVTGWLTSTERNSKASSCVDVDTSFWRLDRDARSGTVSYKGSVVNGCGQDIAQVDIDFTAYDSAKKPVATCTVGFDFIDAHATVPASCVFSADGTPPPPGQIASEKVTGIRATLVQPSVNPCMAPYRVYLPVDRSQWKVDALGAAALTPVVEYSGPVTNPCPSSFATFQLVAIGYNAKNTQVMSCMTTGGPLPALATIRVTCTFTANDPNVATSLGQILSVKVAYLSAWG